MASDSQQNVPNVRVAILDDYTDSKSPLSGQIFNAAFQQNSRLSSQISYKHFPATLNTRTPEGLQTAIERYQPFQVICSMRERTPFPAELIRSLPNLKLLLTTGTRNAAIDLDAARASGVVVAGTRPKVTAVKGFDSTNEQTWALILAVTKGLAADDLRVKSSDGDGWQDGTNVTLAGKTLGLLGLGKLGTQAAITGTLGFGMKAIAWSENLTQEKADAAAQERGLAAGTFKVVTKEELFQQADVLSCHLVLSDRSRGIVGSKELALMKNTAVLINTSRGPLIQENAVVDALKTGKIRGVGFDVFDVEPLPSNSVWRDPAWGKKVVLSPHTGYVEIETLTSWYEQQARNVQRYLQGEEIHDVMT